MEFVEGIKISHADELARGRLRHRPSSARVFIRSIIKQVLVDGFFHGDPHPGNVLADPRPTSRSSSWTWASSGSSNRQQRVDLLGLIYAIKEVDIPGIGDGLIALGKPTPTFDEAGFRDDIDRLAHQYLVYGKVDSLGRGARGLPGRGVRQRPAARQPADARDQGRHPGRGDGPGPVVRHRSRRGRRRRGAGRAAGVAHARSDPEAGPESARIRIGKELARRAPSLEGAALKWLDMFNQGKIVGRGRHQGLERSIASVDGLGRQATVGVIVVGQLIGTAIVMAILLQPTLTQFQSVAYLAMIAFGGDADRQLRRPVPGVPRAGDRDG